MLFGDSILTVIRHGHTFEIVRVSNSDVTNYVNPPRRDVVPRKSESRTPSLRIADARCLIVQLTEET